MFDREDKTMRGTSGAYAGTGSYKRAVGLFYSRDEVESALRDLKGGGYDMDRVSIMGKNADNVAGADDLNQEHGNEAAEGAAAGATTGTVLGGIGGFLVGAGVLAIPGVGPVLAAGVGISEIAATLAGAGIGAAAGGLIGGLVGLGIPEERAKVYSDRIKGGSFFMMVDGTDDDVRRAESIMRNHGVEEFEIFDAPAGTVSTKEPVVTEPRPVVTEPRPVATEPRTSMRNETVKTRDIDNDADPEIIIVDKRDEIR